MAVGRRCARGAPSRSRWCGVGRHGRGCRRVGGRAVAEKGGRSPAPEVAGTSRGDAEEYRGVNDFIRSGGTERRWLLKQAAKTSKRTQIRKLGSVLKGFGGDGGVDVLVVGCGPAGMALASSLAEESAKRGGAVKVGLIGPDVPFVNTYGVWMDEFEELGLEGCVEKVFDDAISHFGDGEKGFVNVGRRYAKVDLDKLQDHLLSRCQEAGVVFEEGQVRGIDHGEGQGLTTVRCKSGASFVCDVAILASGAASTAFLDYEKGVPDAGAQTAYGFEVEVDSYPFDSSAMHFMDFRRHHSGVWQGKALHPGMTRALQEESSWGTRREVPSFLYAMPLGGNKAFFQETCLVAKDAVPFSVLKRRLETRLNALGVKVKAVLDEEWSYIPVGGPLPDSSQRTLAYGATANMIHPASGYSVARSLKGAPEFARDVMGIYDRRSGSGWTEEASALAWNSLWSDEKRKCAAFHIFGMELLALMDVKSINDFFLAFFSLPEGLWKGFLSSSLNSNQLLFFALSMFAVAPVHMKAKLVGHLFHPAGAYLLKAYNPLQQGEEEEEEEGPAP
ncbi:lycopene epsilon cyclase [Chloropicon primus]|nr:lycopene epsilon cyclase [Chloropicon primus]